MFNYIGELRTYFYHNNVKQEDLQKIYEFADLGIAKAKAAAENDAQEYIEEIDEEIESLEDELEDLEDKLMELNEDEEDETHIEGEVNSIKCAIEELEIEKDDFLYKIEIENDMIRWYNELLEELELLCEEFNLEFDYPPKLKERELQIINNPNQLKFDFME